jgi:hypothetical protein
MMMDKSLGERPKSMLAMTRLAARHEGMPIAIPNSVRASVSRKIIQRMLRPERDANTDSARAAGDAVGHQPIKANRSKQQREGGERRVSKLTWSFEDPRAHICDH